MKYSDLQLSALTPWWMSSESRSDTKKEDDITERMKTGQATPEESKWLQRNTTTLPGLLYENFSNERQAASGELVEEELPDNLRRFFSKGHQVIRKPGGDEATFSHVERANSWLNDAPSLPDYMTVGLADQKYYDRVKGKTFRELPDIIGPDLTKKLFAERFGEGYLNDPTVEILFGLPSESLYRKRMLDSIDRTLQAAREAPRNSFFGSAYAYPRNVATVVLPGRDPEVDLAKVPPKNNLEGLIQDFVHNDFTRDVATDYPNYPYVRQHLINKAQELFGPKDEFRFGQPIDAQASEIPELTRKQQLAGVIPQMFLPEAGGNEQLNFLFAPDALTTTAMRSVGKGAFNTTKKLFTK